MSIRLPLIIFITMLLCFESRAQLPPQLISWTDTIGNDYMDLYVTFSPNDTGVIMAQVQLDQGNGNETYDSTYTIPAADSINAHLHITPIFICTYYDLLFNMSNEIKGQNGQGIDYNPLFSFTSLCTSGVTTLADNNFSLIADGRLVGIRCNDIPQNAFAEVYDLQGRRISSAKLTQSTQQINLNVSGGVYLLRILDDSQLLYTAKFVIL